jgi:hypothetical protein
MKLLKKLALSTAIVGALIGALAPAYAITEDPQVYAGTKIIPARNCSEGQNVCYIRATINYNDSNISAGVWFASIPANAYVLSIDAYVSTAFNAASTNLLSIGATKTGTDFVATSGANASVTLGSTGITHLTAAAGLATVATGNTSLQSGYSSTGTGPVPAYVPIFARYTQTGTAATAGAVTIVITYAKNNDQ